MYDLACTDSFGYCSHCIDYLPGSTQFERWKIIWKSTQQGLPQNKGWRRRYRCGGSDEVNPVDAIVAAITIIIEL